MLHKLYLAAGFLLVLLLTGCVADDYGKRTRLDFTVVVPEDIPQELQEIIDSHKEKEIQMSYDGEDGMYIIRGYGKQPTGGYSISADVLEMAEDGIHLTTTLLEPDVQENPVKEPSYPYLVIRTEKSDANIIFE